MDGLNILIPLSIILTLAALEGKQGMQTNYCKLKCDRGQTHIACRNSLRFAKDCPSNLTIVEFHGLPEMILSFHNNERTRVAQGNDKRFKIAARMSEMVWDEELAYLALLHEINCKNENPNECRSTKQYKYPGQNKGYLMKRVKAAENNIMFPLLEIFKRWIDSGKRAKWKDMEEYHRNEVSSYSLILNEKNSRVGCAVLKNDETPNIYTYMTCNYAFNNIPGQAVYAEGEVPGDQCSTDKSIAYPSMCSKSEVYD